MQLFCWLRVPSRAKSFSSYQTHFSMLLEFFPNRSEHKPVLSALLFSCLYTFMVFSDLWLLWLFSFYHSSHRKTADANVFSIFRVKIWVQDFPLEAISDLQSSLFILFWCCYSRSSWTRSFIHWSKHFKTT